MKNVRLDPAAPAYWQEDKPDPETVTTTVLSQLCSTVLRHTKEYYDLLEESIKKAENSDDERVQEKLEEWTERLDGIEQLAMLAADDCPLDQVFSAFADSGDLA